MSHWPVCVYFRFSESAPALGKRYANAIRISGQKGKPRSDMYPINIWEFMFVYFELSVVFPSPLPKDNIKTSHASYLRQHPEIRSLVSDFLQFLLLRKPDDVFQFARKYFLQFVCYRSTESHHNAPPLKKATPENSSWSQRSVVFLRPHFRCN